MRKRQHGRQENIYPFRSPNTSCTVPPPAPESAAALRIPDNRSWPSTTREDDCHPARVSFQPPPSCPFAITCKHQDDEALQTTREARPSFLFFRKRVKGFRTSPLNKRRNKRAILDSYRGSVFLILSSLSVSDTLFVRASIFGCDCCYGGWERNLVFAGPYPFADRNRH